MLSAAKGKAAESAKRTLGPRDLGVAALPKKSSSQGVVSTRLVPRVQVAAGDMGSHVPTWEIHTERKPG